MHQKLFEAVEGIRSTTSERFLITDTDQTDAGALSAVQQDVSNLSKKLNDVVASLGGLETQLFSQSLERYGSRAELAEMLSEACKQLEERVLTLESKSNSGRSNHLSESLQHLQTAAQSLETLVNKDVQPKLDSQGMEMRRISGELNGLCVRINSMVSQTSMVTTTSTAGHCLACFEVRKPATSTPKMHMYRGKDSSNQQSEAETSFATVSSPVDQLGLINVSNRPKSHEKLALQGGAGAPLRKYRIPVGADGNPTWALVKNTSSSTPNLMQAAGRGKGLPPPTERPHRARPQSATVPGTALHPVLGSLRLVGTGSDGDASVL